MTFTRSIIGALTAGGLVLGIGSAAGASPGWDCDWDDDDYYSNTYSVHKTVHVTGSNDSAWERVIVNHIED